MSKKKKNNDDGIILNDKAPFAIQEAYKTLRTNVMFSLSDEKCKTIVLTSASSGEGKSITAINLALALADNHLKVLLIDCDLRLPTIARKLGLMNSPGLTNYLYNHEKDTGKLFQKYGRGLFVITAGDIPPNPSETLDSKNMSNLLMSAEKVFDYIILDTPPIGTVTDAAIVAKKASGVILVVREGVATYENVSNAISQLKMVDAKIIGTVMNGTTPTKKKYKKYKYGYGSQYDYSNYDKKKG